MPNLKPLISIAKLHLKTDTKIRIWANDTVQRLCISG